MIRFIHKHPALYISEEKILVIADLHCGIEHSIYKSGISVPSQTKKIEEKIVKLIKQTKAKKLIILGDVKHEVPGTSKQELKEIPAFLRDISKKVKIIICRGNHDSNIQDMVPKVVKVHGTGGFKIGKYGFLHGQAWMDKKLLECEYLITAHVHPAIEFTTNKIRMRESCWVKCEIDRKKLGEKFGNIGSSKKSVKAADIKKSKISRSSISKKYARSGFAAPILLRQAIIMPAFNHLLGGKAFNAKYLQQELPAVILKKDFKPIGPLLRNGILKWKKAKIYLLDGTYLGRLDKL